MGVYCTLHELNRLNPDLLFAKWDWPMKIIKGNENLAHRPKRKGPVQICIV